MSVNLNVKTYGPATGENIVLIHGWPLSGASWQAQIGALTQAGARVTVYDRRGFGEADKPQSGYDYDTFADDLADVLNTHDLQDVTLVGFSMGGGEVARYMSRHKGARVKRLVFAASVTPFMLKKSDNPEGPLTEQKAQEMEAALQKDRAAFFEDFTTKFFSVGKDLKVSEMERQQAVALCLQSDENAALQAMRAFATTDFRDDLKRIDTPTLVLHGEGDQTVPLIGSADRTHAAILGSQIQVIADAPHGMNVSHSEAFNQALIDFIGLQAPD